MIITLEELKKRPINRYINDMLYRTLRLGDDWNERIYKERMLDEYERRYCIADIVQEGNDPRDSKEILDIARCYIERGLYTDEQWEKYIIPAINEIIAYNESFVRWMPGYLIRSKKYGNLCIVEYDFAMGFGYLCGHENRDYTSLALCRLRKGEPAGSWAWANYKDYELVDTEHTQENIAKVRDYHISNKHQVPYYLSSKMERMFYR